MYHRTLTLQSLDWINPEDHQDEKVELLLIQDFHRLSKKHLYYPKEKKKKQIAKLSRYEGRDCKLISSTNFKVSKSRAWRCRRPGFLDRKY